MKSTSIPYVRRYKQEGRKPMNDIDDSMIELPREGFPGEPSLNTRTFINYVESVIREYATFRGDCFELFAQDLPQCEKKIFLSHLVCAADYEDYISKPTLCEMAVLEYTPQMQRAIDDHIDDYYHDWVRNAGFDE